MKLPKVDIKRILYATDLSENARYAFAYAVSLANLYGAVISIVHILQEVSDYLDSHVVGYIGKDQWEEIKNRHFEDARKIMIGKRRDNVAIKEILDRFCKEVKADDSGLDFETDEIIVRRGNAVEEILKTAEERRCDLIVMGTRGLGTLAGAMMGNTARRVLRRSKKPVLVVKLPKN